VFHLAPDDRIGRRAEKKHAHNELRFDFSAHYTNFT